MYNNQAYANQYPNQYPIGQPGLDAYGRPIFQLPTYEQQIALRQEMMRQQKEYLRKRLEEKYPTKFVIFYGVILIIIAIAEIVLHIVSIVYKGAYYTIGHGIWGGAILIVLAVIALLLIKYRKTGLYTASLILHSIGITAVAMALVFVSALSFSEYNTSSYSYSYSKYSSSRTTTPAANVSMLPVTAVMVALGGVATILVLTYLICLCRVASISPRSRAANAGMVYPANQATIPMNTQQMGYNPNYPPPSYQPMVPDQSIPLNPINNPIKY